MRKKLRQNAISPIKGLALSVEVINPSSFYISIEISLPNFFLFHFVLDFFPVASISKSSRSNRQRHFYDEAQLAVLDAEFARDSFPNREGRRRIALLIGVSEKSIMWWFQNRRRRIRQRGFGSAVTSQSYETSRQQRRPSPYTQCRQVQQDLPHCLPTSGGYPFTQTLDEHPTNYWANESSPTSSQFQPVPVNSESTSCTNYYQEMNPQVEAVDYSTGYQPSHQQEQCYSFWNNWEYAPPFCPSSANTMQNTANVYQEDPYNYSNMSYYSYYPSEYCNQVYM
ncbi:hypothetical protein GHT06_013874 [Daphnia sinensis]|uniref:Homeobox domain-containing protein n=1 Tax=Daphnia sinensis TaxID=1820382 RepID=A0AAD5KVI5_9CRUS|nr:hypothetical protein GHT06_013874 [Daphnia sinensis]